MRLGVPPPLAQKKLAETERRDWVAAIDAARSRGPAAAAGFYRYASAFLSWAEASGLISSHPLPRRGAAQLAPASKHRLLGRTQYAALSGFSGIKSRLDTLAPLDPWSWHDLRRSCRTGMARLGIDDAAAEAAIGHVSNRSKLVRTYDRYNRAEEARQALLTWQSHVAALVAPESRAADVVRLDPRRRRVG